MPGQKACDKPSSPSSPYSQASVDNLLKRVRGSKSLEELKAVVDYAVKLFNDHLMEREKARCEK